ncbi:MAG: aminomethyl transferase family protein [Acidobacteriota bacterium]
MAAAIACITTHSPSRAAYHGFGIVALSRRPDNTHSRLTDRQRVFAEYGGQVAVTPQNLDTKLRQYGNAVDMLRRSTATPDAVPIQAEFTNWRDEQEAWRTSAALFDQSHHMTDLHVEGPDVIRLLSALGVNSFKNFGCNRAKQLVVCNPDGFVIADGLLLGLESERVSIVGRPSMANWVEFHARTGGYDVAVHRDDHTSRNPLGRRVYRFEMQGPNVLDILEKVNGGPLPAIQFFHLAEMAIAGRRVRALRRRGMCGAAGIEIWGPMAEGPAVLDELMTAGAEFGLKRCGARAQSTFATESGWIASPLPAIYSGLTMKAYREWLSADSFEATASLGGSYSSKRIQDYYLTPWDLGYGHFVKLDHDFIGRDALAACANQPHRRKVSLSWDSDDILRVFESMLGEGDRAKYMEMPAACYTTFAYDTVLKDGRSVGISTYLVYTSNGREWISTAIVDEEVAQPGTEVGVLWGESDGGAAKSNIEAHVQMPIHAIVVPSPYSDRAGEPYRPYAFAGI